MRRTLPFVLPVLVTACSVSIGFSIERELSLSGPAGAFSVVQQVDLSQEPDVWSRRDQIESITIDEVRAELVSVGAHNHARTATVSLRFRPDGAPSDGSADVVLALDDLAMMPGTTVRVEGSGSPALQALIADALQGTGTFTLIAEGRVDGAVDATIRMNVDARVTVRLQRQ